MSKSKADDQKNFLLDLLKTAEVVEASVPQPDPNNPRVHETRNVTVIKTSLKRFGQVVPILLEAGTDVIVSGHGTLRCIKELGMGHVLVVRRKFKSKKEREQLRDMMNRSAELAEWDYELLGKAIRGYQSDENMAKLGWEQYELGPILAADWKPPPLTDLPPNENRGTKMGQPIVVTKDQREVISRAIAKVKKDESDPSMSEGRCLELISADYLAGT